MSFYTGTTENGFVNRYQGVLNDGVRYDYKTGIINTGYTILSGYKYNLEFTYRSSSGLTAFLTYNLDYGRDIYSTSNFIIEAPMNISNAIRTGVTNLVCIPKQIGNENSVKHLKYLGFIDPNGQGSEPFIDYSYFEIDKVDLYHTHPPSSPVCSTLPYTNQSLTGITLNGMVNSYNLSTTAKFLVYSASTWSSYDCEQSPIPAGYGSSNIDVSIIIPYTSGSSYYINYYLYGANSIGGFSGNTMQNITG